MPQLESAFYISQVFWLFFCLLVTIVFVHYVFYPRIKKQVLDRSAHIQSCHEAISSLEKKTASMQEKNALRLAEKKKEMRERMQEALEHLEKKKTAHFKTLEEEFLMHKRHMVKRRTSISQEVVSKLAQTCLDKLKIHPK